jgi:hypothetical protein
MKSRGAMFPGFFFVAISTIQVITIQQFNLQPLNKYTSH